MYEVMVLALLIPYSFVKSLKLLSPFSTFANVITFVGNDEICLFAVVVCFVVVLQ